MAKSIKLKNDTYLDSTSIVHNKEPLNKIINPVVLYENTNGTNKDITLSDTIENYNAIEIFYKSDGEANYTYTKVLKPYSNVALVSIIINLTGQYQGVFFRLARVSLSSNKITVTKNGQLYGGGSHVNEGATGNFIYITKVLGYIV